MCNLALVLLLKTAKTMDVISGYIPSIRSAAPACKSMRLKVGQSLVLIEAVNHVLDHTGWRLAYTSSMSTITVPNSIVEHII